MMDRYFKGVQPHINTDKIDADIAFLPGPPERSVEIARKFSSCEKITGKREFVTYTGELDGVKVCVTSTGIGCPSAAIVVEELANCGVRMFIRVGTTGAIQERIRIGDVIVAEAAVRDDGTTEEYIGAEYPAVASSEVIGALRRSAGGMRIRHHTGVVRTNDAFYGAPDFGSIVRSYGKFGVLSLEMECAAVFTVARFRGLEAGAVLGVVGNIVRGEHAYKNKEEDPRVGEYKKKAGESVEAAIKVAVGAVKYL